jgi:hypothetical protein
MGFTKTIIKAGSGQLPRKGQQVTVHCTGFGMKSLMWTVPIIIIYHFILI